jgi:Ca2+-binding EF-hand superfamily protein
LLVELADDEHLKEIFNKYAKHSILEQKAIKSEDLVQKYLGLLAENDFDEQTLKILANSVDLNKDGYITVGELFIYTKNNTIKASKGTQVPLIFGNQLEKIPLAKIRK